MSNVDVKVELLLLAFGQTENDPQILESQISLLFPAKDRGALGEDNSPFFELRCDALCLDSNLLERFMMDEA